MLSEAELHLLRLRMDAGRLRQVEAGTYRQNLPTGLLRLENGCVVKDPDLQIQRTLELVFARFAALGSAQKVMRSLRDDGVLLPRRQRGGPYHGQVLWRKPSASALMEILRNPAYAGAFAYGRKGPHPERRPGQARTTTRSVEEWTIIHQGVYSSYISWMMCSQLTRVIARGNTAHRKYIADLNRWRIDHDPLDQQFDDLPAAGKVRLVQATGKGGAEGLELPGELRDSLVPLPGGLEGLSVATHRGQAGVQPRAPGLQFLQRERSRGVGIDQPLDLAVQFHLAPLQGMVLVGLGAVV
jgi:hypothetical protein